MPRSTSLVCPGVGVEKPLRREFIEKAAGYTFEVFAACLAHRCPVVAAPVRPSAGPAASMRDESFQDDIRRETQMMLAMAHAALRLTIKVLRRLRLIASEFVTMEVLPFPVVRHVHNYLTAQIASRAAIG